MALIHCDFFSNVLKLCSSMTVILPQAAPETPAAASVTKPPARRPLQGAGRSQYPVLWLLHGMSDDHTIWQRRTSIERYVDPLGLAVVMPAVARSFYTDMHSGPKYWTFISEELPEIARAFFPLSTAREDNFVAGLSMGGYGAFKLGLRQPERFAAAASLSGATNVASWARRGPRDEWQQERRRIFGDLKKIPGSENDLLHLASQLVETKTKAPRLFQWCGTEDFLYQDNLVFRDHALKLGLDLTYSEAPGGHEWKHWDSQIQRVLDWLPLKKK